MNESAVKKSRGPRLTPKLLRTLIVCAVVVVLLVAGAIGLRSAFSTESETKELGFRDIGELATQVAYCTEVSVTDASRELFGVTIPFTQSKYIYSYDVIVKAGLNFDQIDYIVDNENFTIKVTLPEIRVLSCEINPESFKLYHEAESIFRQITMEENNQALVELQESAQANAIHNGLLENAQANAEALLTGFFAQVYDLNVYTITYVTQGAAK